MCVCVRDMYKNSFRNLVHDFSYPQTSEDGIRLCKFVEDHLNTMSEVIPTVAQGKKKRTITLNILVTRKMQ